MCGHIKCSSGASLDKLGQRGTKSNTDGFNKNLSKQVFDGKTLTKRARRKYFSQNIAYQLVNASRDDKLDSMERQYWQTVHCGQYVQFDGIETKSAYCKKRWCTVCNSIRTAQLISKYQPTINDWNDKHFLTLTIKSVTGENLKTKIDEMLTDLRKIRDTAKKRYQRGQMTIKPMSINKIECNYNPDKNTFNPHFHVITSSLEFAEMLRDEWVKRHSSSEVKIVAQKIVKADNETTSELFKYFTKMITTTDGKKEVFADALNTIFKAIKGRRTLFHYGFKQNIVEVEIAEIDTYEDAQFDEIDGEVRDVSASPPAMQTPGFYRWNKCDWFHVDTGESLTGYVPSDKFVKFLQIGLKFTDGRKLITPTMPEWVQRGNQYKILSGSLETVNFGSARSVAGADADGDMGVKTFPSQLYLGGDEYSNFINSIKYRKNESISNSKTKTENQRIRKPLQRDTKALAGKPK